jgi:hypothetical protein
VVATEHSVASVGREVQRAGERASSSRTFGGLLTAGLVVYGAVHLVIAWIALSLAWGRGGADDPVRVMARSGPGRAALWLAAVGLLVLVAWRVLEAIAGHQEASGRRRVLARAGAAAQAVTYAALALSAAQAALTSGRQGTVEGQGRKDSSMGAALMRHWWGIALVAIIGLVLVVLGVRMIVRGFRRSFTEDLAMPVSSVVVIAGEVGTVIKGVVLIIVGILFGVAVVTYDPSKTGGLDAALNTLRGQWYGPAVLTVIGVGLAVFGGYCFAWSAHAKH